MRIGQNALRQASTGDRAKCSRRMQYPWSRISVILSWIATKLLPVIHQSGKLRRLVQLFRCLHVFGNGPACYAGGSITLAKSLRPFRAATERVKGIRADQGVRPGGPPHKGDTC